jgi:geranylgeranyl diphosphate synthase type I
MSPLAVRGTGIVDIGAAAQRTLRRCVRSSHGGLGSATVSADDPASGFADRVQAVLDGELSRHRRHLEDISDDLLPLVDELAAMTRGGKRLRPAFCYWGYRGAGAPDSEAIVRASTSLELLHAAALIHDDVMDRADTRRGRPASHTRFADLHTRSGWWGSATQYGDAAAVLLGDLCLGWSDELLGRSGLDATQLGAGRAVFEAMRTDVMCGQYLDMLVQAGRDVTRALDEAQMIRRTQLVIHYKSAKYSVQAPMLMGAAMAGAPAALRESYSSFGLAVGEAFQLRDDVLGVFGDPGTTGKPAGDDIREGKQTMLVGFAITRGSQAQRDILLRHLGDADVDEDAVTAAREVLTDSGALAEVEARIAMLVEEALGDLGAAEMDAEVRDGLNQLAVRATRRDA